MLRRRRPLHLVGIGLGLLAAIVVSALLYGDLPEFLHADLPEIGRAMREFLVHSSFLAGFALLYIEESGIPLPAPGDVFVMYVGVHIPHNVGSWLVAWLGLIAAVLLGATNLYLIARKFGPVVAHSRFADYVHLSPDRLEKAEKWFQRYGALAIIFGRHIPGFRVPITVAAATLGVPYRVFAPSVAVSTAIWAGVMLTLGMTIGPR
ncbi:MAG TPA: DedA family protein, partial [Candidatus Udaeobacter sp.]|nr:DedA family protein [Candidatus Udaeobacter sp.]